MSRPTSDKGGGGNGTPVSLLRADVASPATLPDASDGLVATEGAGARKRCARSAVAGKIHALETLHGVDITGEGTIGPPGAA